MYLIAVCSDINTIPHFQILCVDKTQNTVLLCSAVHTVTDDCLTVILSFQF